MKTRYVGVLFLAAHLTIAHSAPFKVYSPVVESGVTEIEAYGFRDFDRRDEVDGSQTHKLGVGHGFTDHWFSEVYGEFEKEGPEALKLESFEWENRFQFAPQGKYRIDTGLLVEYEQAVHSDDPNKITVAPLLETELGSRTVATVNLRFSHETGRNAAPGTTFSYAARLKYNLDPLFEPALEFFGDAGKIDRFSSGSREPSWLGPAFYGKVKLGHGQAFVYSAAALFGLTEAASDKRAVLRAEYEF